MDKTLKKDNKYYQKRIHERIEIISYLTFVVVAVLYIKPYLVSGYHEIEKVFTMHDGSPEPFINALCMVCTSLVICVVYSLLDQFLHENIHSLRCYMLKKDWGEVTYTLKRGHFHTDKELTVSQFAAIAMTPFHFETLVFLILLLIMYFRGNTMWVYNIAFLMITNYMCCGSDISETISYKITEKPDSIISLEKPEGFRGKKTIWKQLIDSYEYLTKEKICHKAKNDKELF